jgi:hypothetical protein
MLGRFRHLRIGSWNYKGDKRRHYGPMAQEWFAAFGHDGIGTIGNDTTLATADVDGVLCIAVQALENRSTTTREKLATHEAQIQSLREQLNAKNEEIVKLRKQLAAQQAAHAQHLQKSDHRYSNLERLVHELHQAQKMQDQHQAQLLNKGAGH